MSLRRAGQALRALGAAAALTLLAGAAARVDNNMVVLVIKHELTSPDLCQYLVGRR